jgi:hypothetical protein
MRNIFFSLFLAFVCTFSKAQELNCTVKVNAQQLSNASLSVFKTLETSLTDFVNKTQWTTQTFKQNEKINCSMYITVSSYNSDQFVATIQVQSARPIHNSSYTSPVFNFNDKDFSFKYSEFEALNFNPTTFESNLVSVITFYSYLILGMDADSFVQGSGDTYYDTAKNISDLAQQSGFKGWRQSDGNQNRYFLINDLLSPTFSDIRNTIFAYHKGLDSMNVDLKESKEKIKKAILNLSKLNATRPNSFLARVFFDAKSDEIVSIFSGGPTISISDLVDNLNKISPLNSTKWSTIKY